MYAMKSHQNKTFFFVALLIVLWISAAWLIADHNYYSRAKTIIDEQTHIIEDQADDFAESVRRNLHFLQGISNMVSNLARVHVAISRFGSGTQPSRRSQAYLDSRQRLE